MGEEKDREDKIAKEEAPSTDAMAWALYGKQWI